jgi:hypothetical protein
MSTNKSIAFRIPIELVVVILSYINDAYATRKGELIKIINKKDERYKILKENLRLHIFVAGGESDYLCIFDKDKRFAGGYNVYGSKYGYTLSICKRDPTTNIIRESLVIFRNYCGKNGCGYNRRCNCDEVHYNNVYLREIENTKDEE